MSGNPNRCPRCRRPTLRVHVYLDVSAPASFYGRLCKTRLRDARVRIEAALWPAVSWQCERCGYSRRDVKQVRLVDVSAPSSYDDECPDE